jgi:hypothetical protein
MAVDETFRAVIAVDDRTSAPIRQIQQNLARLGESTGLTRLGRITGRISASMAGLVRTTASIAPPLAAVGALGAGAGLVQMARSATDSVGELQRLSTITGLAVADLQELGSVARATSGVELDNFADSMQELQNAMREAASGGNKDVADLFKKLRIPLTQMRNGRREVRSLAEVLPELAEGFRLNTDPALRVVMASKLMTDEGRRLIPMLAGGARGLADARAEARQYAATLDGETLESVRRNRQGMMNFTASMDGLRLAIGTRVAPALGELGQHFAGLIRINREAIAERLGGWATEISASLKGVDWTGVAAGMESVGRTLRSLNETITNTIGWKNAFVGLGALLAAPFAASALSAMVSLGKIIAFIGGPVTVAIAGIGTAIVLAWKHWDRIKGFVEGVNAAMVRLQEGAIASVLTGFREILAVVERIMEAWNRGQAFQSPAAPTPGQGQNRFQGRAGGLYGGPALDPDTGQPAFRRQSFSSAPTDVRPLLQRINYPSFPRSEEAPLFRERPLTVERPAMPSLWGPSSGPGGSRDGKHRLEVEFLNTPPGTRVRTESTGSADRFPVLSVGYARMGIA